MTDHYLHIQDNVREAAMEKFSKAFPVVFNEVDTAEGNAHIA